MYGLINNAIRQLTIERCGPQTWSDIAGDLGLEDRFISMNHYPDALSAQLVSRLSEAMDVSPDVVLQQLGIYWVSKASKEYSDLFSQLGPSLTTALQNLDSLHSRVALSFPDLSPPLVRLYGYLQRWPDPALLLDPPWPNELCTRAATRYV